MSYDLKELQRLEKEATRPKSTIGADAVFSKALTAAAPELLERMAKLEAALVQARDALRTVASCSVCKEGITVGFQTRHDGCWPDDDAGEPTDLDQIVQDAWEALDALTTAEPR